MCEIDWYDICIVIQFLTQQLYNVPQQITFENPFFIFSNKAIYAEF